MIDLHTHSNCSDGSDSPAELISNAKKSGVSVIALTDHDNVKGLKEANLHADKLGIKFIPGIEITTDFEHGEFHLLGYKIDYNSLPFNQELAAIGKSREQRNIKLIDKLQKSGIKITYEEVKSTANSTQIGRLHIALCLIGKGLASSVEDAFTRYVGAGGQVYTKRIAPTPQEAIQMIKRYGGVTVMAHPCYIDLDHKKLDTLCKKLKKAGLDGIEVHYIDHTEEQKKFYLQLAAKYDLKVTGGTDYHGKNSPGKTPGIGYGTLVIPDSCADFLL